MDGTRSVTYVIIAFFLGIIVLAEKHGYKFLVKNGYFYDM